MAAQSTLKNMVLCLTAVCLVCSALLGVIYVVTEEPIADASKKALNSALLEVLPSEGEIAPEALFSEMDGVNYEYYLQNVNDSTANIAIKSTVNGFGGPLTVLVGIENCGFVHSAKVLSHSETPGLGAKCQSDEHFIHQFDGFDPAASKLVVKKDGGDVDAITASTITSRAYTLAVENAVKVAAKIKEEKK